MPVVIMLLVFTVGYLFQAINLPMGTLRNIGPGFYPVFISFCMLVVLVVQIFREKKKATLPKLKVNKFQLIFIVLFGGLIVMLEKVGYFGTAVVFILSFSMLLGWQLLESYKDEQKKYVLILYPLAAAVAVTLLDYALFELAFDFNLP
ncbi:tripartite tricarboxylate transporter TctB family protein [Desulfopila inferna]|uniref:tripartite tricarboxylate transporter TctB family protein n=1 Tax=Desulfopila inferna TaxID=468528 RepID=UPI0019634D6B|nr:tripartite tricarboxylate transporter TctB family protein [Desulfopila inferna]MBM9605774.1 tripartite tricarboxylate transporter TctB family protein [Desulfopila inferna]